MRTQTRRSRDNASTQHCAFCICISELDEELRLFYSVNSTQRFFSVYVNRPELVEETNQFGKDWKIPIHLPICKRNAYACKFWIRSGALSTCNGYGQQQNKYYTFFCRRRRCAHWNSLQDLYFISENRQHTIFFIEILPSCEGGEVVDEDNMRTKRQQIYDSDICIMYNGTITSNCSSLRQPILSFSARGRNSTRPPVVCLAFSPFCKWNMSGDVYASISFTTIRPGRPVPRRPFGRTNYGPHTGYEYFMRELTSSNLNLTLNLKLQFILWRRRSAYELERTHYAVHA